MTLKKLLYLPLLLFTFIAAGCGDDGPTEPDEPSFTGTWVGTLVNASVEMTANETEGSINGSGIMSVGTERFAFTATGTHAHPDVSFTVSSAGYEDFNFSGEFTNDNTVVGEVNGSGFTDDTLTLRRQ